MIPKWLQPKRYVLQAGMGRSGSTLSYRLIKEIVRPTRQLVHVGKTHDFNERLYRKSSLIVTSRRDIRDVVASELRQEQHRRAAGMKCRPEWTELGFLVKRHARFYWQWYELSDYEFVYEEYVDSPYGVIDDLLYAISNAGIEVPCEESRCEIKDAAESTRELEHGEGQHRTNGGVIGAYRDVMSETDAERVVDLWESLKPHARREG